MHTVNSVRGQFKSALKETDEAWKLLILELEQQFGPGLDLSAVLFLIGVQELGINKRKFGKDQKLELMHIAICTVLEPYGFYTPLGRDTDGYPHWELDGALPALTAGQQSQLMKEAILHYFDKK